MLKIANLLGSAALSADLPLSADLNENTPIGAEGISLDIATLSGEAKLPTPWAEVELGADHRASATVSVLATDEALPASYGFGGTSTAVPPANHAYALLRLDGKASLSTRAAALRGARVSLSGALGVDASFTTSHALAVLEDTPLTDALTALAARSRLPMAVELEDLRKGEVHQLVRRLNLDLEVAASAGWKEAVDGALFHEMAPALRAEFEASLSAAFGLSLFEDFRFAIGSVDVSRPQWVRVALERVDRKRLTLGARFALQVRHNAGSALVRLLDEVLGLSPFGRLLDALEKVGPYLRDDGSIDWAALGTDVEDWASEGLLNAIGADEWLDSDEQKGTIESFVALAREVVAAYRDLPDRAQDLLYHLLGYADLNAPGSLRRALATIEGLAEQKADSLEALVVVESGVVPLIEAFTGRDLESLLVEEVVGETLTEAATAARAIREFLEGRSGNAAQKKVEEVLTRLQVCAEHYGIGGVISWLEQNAGSVEELKQALSQKARGAVRALVERLLGKGLGQIDLADHQRLQRFIQKVRNTLDEAGSFEKQLRALDGELGFSLGLEIDRLSRHSAVLDVELDPNDRDCRKAYDYLQTGDVSAFLAALPAAATEEPENLPYRLRSCVLTSRRVRSTAVSVLFSLIGGQKTRRQRVEEQRVEGTIGRYAAGFVQTNTQTTGTLFGGTWLWFRAVGGGPTGTEGYEKIEPRLRLTVARWDNAASRFELDALGHFLRDLGFQGIELLTTLPEAVPLRLGIALEAPEAAVLALLPKKGQTKKESWGDADYDRDFLNAAYRWYSERLLKSPKYEQTRFSESFVSSKVVLSPRFRERWRKVGNSDETWPFEFEGATYYARERTPPARHTQALIWARGTGVPKLVEVRQGVEQALESREFVDLATLLRGAADALARTSPWRPASPLFLLRLCQARLTRRAPEALGSFHGVATLAWKLGDRWERRMLGLGETGLAPAVLVV